MYWETRGLLAKSSFGNIIISSTEFVRVEHVRKAREEQHFRSFLNSNFLVHI